jgi:DNA-binding beta-propeller fold protein YncE
MPVDGWRGEGDRYVEPFVEVAQDGTLIVSDAKSHRLLCLNQDGTVKQSLGRQGSGMGEFNSPKGLAIASSGEVLVADQLNNRYQRVRIP